MAKVSVQPEAVSFPRWWALSSVWFLCVWTSVTEQQRCVSSVDCPSRLRPVTAVHLLRPLPLLTVPPGQQPQARLTDGSLKPKTDSQGRTAA